MLEKDKFSQQNIDYVLQLRAKEKQGAHHNIGPVAEYKTSSGIYMSLMLEKIFGGMKQQFNKSGAEGGIDEESAGNSEVAKAWLDDFMSSRVQQKLQNITMILRGIKRSMDDPTDEQILDEFRKTVCGAWIGRIFDPLAIDQKSSLASVSFSMGLNKIMADENAKLTIKIKEILRSLRDEDKSAAMEKPEQQLLKKAVV